MSKSLAKKAEAMRLYRKKNPNKMRSLDLKKCYGITLDQYNILLEVQRGVCAICKKAETVVCNKKGDVRNLAVDHNHVTGEVRGLLCTACNQGLGNFKDSIASLTQAAHYLASRNCY
jgi:hypothetical protein